jgi:hypothetical protein
MSTNEKQDDTIYNEVLLAEVNRMGIGPERLSLVQLEHLGSRLACDDDLLHQFLNWIAQVREMAGL